MCGGVWCGVWCLVVHGSAGVRACRVFQLSETFAGRKILLGVDRLDYIKGMPHKVSGSWRVLYASRAGSFVCQTALMARHGEACTTHTLCVCTGIDRLSTDGFGGIQNSVLSCGLLVMDAARKTDICHRRGMCLYPPAGVTSPVFGPPLFLVVPAECSAHMSWRFIFLSLP